MIVVVVAVVIMVVVVMIVVMVMVVVVMDFVAQLNAHMMSHQYEGLMRKANLRGTPKRGP